MNRNLCSEGGRSMSGLLRRTSTKIQAELQLGLMERKGKGMHRHRTKQNMSGVLPSSSDTSTLPAVDE